MARQALPAGDVQAFTSYVVNDGVSGPYGQAPADERIVMFCDLRDAADQPARGGQLAGRGERPQPRPGLGHLRL